MPSGQERDWTGLSSVLHPRQHSTGYTRDGLYRSKDSTNSIKVLMEQIVHRKGTGPIQQLLEPAWGNTLQDYSHVT